MSQTLTNETLREQSLEGERHAAPNALGISLDSLPGDFGPFRNSCLGFITYEINTEHVTKVRP